jgi:sigma-E factor negative regulatory protein RseA
VSNEKAKLNNQITKAENVMASGESSKQQISAFADGELPDHEVETIMAVLKASDGRSDWDMYHQIGDTLRSETMALPLSAGFTAQLSARLAAELPLLAPRRRLRDRLAQVWPVAVTAMAAALTGFVIAPQIMRDGSPDPVAPTTVAEAISHAAVIAKADIAPSNVNASEPHAPAINDYIRIHHSSHPSLYGTTQLARPVDLNSSSDH